MGKVNYKPDAYGHVSAYLAISGASEAIEFYKQVFGAQELGRFPAPDGKVGHAELKIGDTVVMLADEYPDMGYVGPQALGGSPVSLMLYVKDVDQVFQNAVELGAETLRPVENQFYGDRNGTLKDPFGHIWTIGTHVEDVTEVEMERRAAAAAGGQD